MNAYDLAEITATLTRRGLDKRLRIKTNTEKINDPALIWLYPAIIKERDGEIIAGLRTDHNGHPTVTANGEIYHGKTYAEAMDKMLDDDPTYARDHTQPRPRHNRPQPRNLQPLADRMGRMEIATSEPTIKSILNRHSDG